MDIPITKNIPEGIFSTTWSRLVVPATPTYPLQIDRCILVSMKKETSKNELILFRGPSGDVKLRGDFKRDTIWETQQEIADVFGVERSVITKHIGNLFKSDEIAEKSNVQKMHIANSDKPVSLYSLDIILAVGYRTNSVTAIF